MNQLTLPATSFSEIPSTANVLLLTPYLHQPLSNTPPTLAMDPFEPFGRELTEHHSRIRHVPYVPKRGMIDMHRSLMREAGGVIVVMCEVLPGSGADGEKLDGVKYQERFAKEAGKMASRLEIPSMLVLVDLDGIRIKYYDGVVKCQDWEELEGVAGAIFQS